MRSIGTLKIERAFGIAHLRRMVGVDYFLLFVIKIIERTNAVLRANVAQRGESLGLHIVAVDEPVVVPHRRTCHHNVRQTAADLRHQAVDGCRSARRGDGEECAAVDGGLQQLRATLRHDTLTIEQRAVEVTDIEHFSRSVHRV